MSLAPKQAAKELLDVMAMTQVGKCVEAMAHPEAARAFARLLALANAMRDGDAAYLAKWAK
jgi:hypothetical protein